MRGPSPSCAASRRTGGAWSGASWKSPRRGARRSNDPALFALALCAAHGDEAVRKVALVALPGVARTGTHLLHFAAFAEGFRGWGRGLRRAVAAWYGDKGLDELALQAVKY